MWGLTWSWVTCHQSPVVTNFTHDQSPQCPQDQGIRLLMTRGVTSHNPANIVTLRRRESGYNETVHHELPFH